MELDRDECRWAVIAIGDYIRNNKKLTDEQVQKLYTLVSKLNKELERVILSERPEER